MSKKNQIGTVGGSEQVLDKYVLALQSIPVTAVIPVDGVSYTQPELLKKAEEKRAFIKKARTAKEASKKASAELRAERRGIRKFLTASKIALKSYLGAENPDIERFGFHFDKTEKDFTTEAKALSAEKARKTREARHTMGSKQKEGIHGQVDEVVIHNPDAKSSKPGPGGGRPTTT